MLTRRDSASSRRDRSSVRRVSGTGVEQSDPLRPPWRTSTPKDRQARRLDLDELMRRTRGRPHPTSVSDSLRSPEESFDSAYRYDSRGTPGPRKKASPERLDSVEPDARDRPAALANEVARVSVLRRFRHCAPTRHRISHLGVTMHRLGRSPSARGASVPRTTRVTTYVSILRSASLDDSTRQNRPRPEAGSGRSLARSRLRANEVEGTCLHGRGSLLSPPEIRGGGEPWARPGMWGTAACGRRPSPSAPPSTTAPISVRPSAMSDHCEPHASPKGEGTRAATPSRLAGPKPGRRLTTRRVPATRRLVRGDAGTSRLRVEREAEASDPPDDENPAIRPGRRAKPGWRLSRSSVEGRADLIRIEGSPSCQARRRRERGHPCPLVGRAKAPDPVAAGATGSSRRFTSGCLVTTSWSSRRPDSVAFGPPDRAGPSGALIRPSDQSKRRAVCTSGRDGFGAGFSPARTRHSSLEGAVDRDGLGTDARRTSLPTRTGADTQRPVPASTRRSPRRPGSRH